MLEIDGWKVNMKFAAAHFIPSHHKCSRLHGHDYALRIRVFGEPTEGILYDFVELKKEARKICDALDHHLLVPRNSDAMEVIREQEKVKIKFGDKEYTVPEEDVVYIDVSLPSAEELASYFARRLRESIKFPENVKGLEVCIDEGPGQGACEYIELGDV